MAKKGQKNLEIPSQHENPLLKALYTRMPGETFRLPSQGLFYNDGELDESVVNGEVHVLPLTAIDEIYMKSPDMLMSGAAIEKVMEKCVPQIKKAKKLLSKDVDYLMMCLRLISYGDELEIIYTHTCENAKKHEYKINLRDMIRTARGLDPTKIGSIFTITVPSGQTVKLCPPTFESVLNLYQSAYEKTNLEGVEIEDMDIEHDPTIQAQIKLLNVITNTIVSVDEITDKESIGEWIKAIPAGWLGEIGKALEKVGDWGIATNIPIKCKDCGEVVDVEVPLNPVSFFF